MDIGTVALVGSCIPVGVAALVVFVLPSVWLGIGDRREDDRWQRAACGTLPVDAGVAYRNSGATVPIFYQRVPRDILRGSQGAGLVAQAVLIVSTVLGATWLFAVWWTSQPPSLESLFVAAAPLIGVKVAALMWSTCNTVIHRDHRAVARTHKAVRVVLLLNAFIFVLSVLAVPVAVGADKWSVLWLIAFVNGYAIVSSLQARHLRRVVGRHVGAFESADGACAATNQR